MNVAVYRDILEENLIFSQETDGETDHNPNHAATIAQDWFLKKNIKKS